MDLKESFKYKYFEFSDEERALKADLKKNIKAAPYGEIRELELEAEARFRKLLDKHRRIYLETKHHANFDGADALKDAGFTKRYLPYILGETDEYPELVVEELKVQRKEPTLEAKKRRGSNKDWTGSGGVGFGGI